IPAIAISNWPACKAGIIPLKSIGLNSMSKPWFSAIAVIKSMSIPVYSPSSSNSNGGYVVSIPTVYFVPSLPPSPDEPLESSAESSDPQAAIRSMTAIRSINKLIFFNSFPPLCDEIHLSNNISQYSTNQNLQNKKQTTNSL